MAPGGSRRDTLLGGAMRTAQNIDLPSGAMLIDDARVYGRIGRLHPERCWPSGWC